MAPRLAVVVSQAPTRDARVADIEESIVAELIMVGGLDATLVGPLNRILPDSTDLLCLSGFTQDFALLSWMPDEEVAKLWADLKLSGTVVPMSLDGSAAPISQVKGQRVFYIQLTAQSEPTQVCKQLKARLELLRVQPVSLQLNLKSPMKSLPVTNPKAGEESKSKPLGQASDGQASDGQASDGQGLDGKVLEQTANSPFTMSASMNSTVSSSSDSQWKNLDKLVDELDSLDL